MILWGWDGVRVNPRYRSSEITWPLHDIVITNIIWSIAYTREVEGGSYIAQ